MGQILYVMGVITILLVLGILFMFYVISKYSNHKPTEEEIERINKQKNN